MRKPSKSALTRKLDALVSKMVRERGYCVKCGSREYEKLQCAHIFSRSNRATRWLPDNLLCLCAKDHFWVHKNPVLFTEWVKEYLGETKYQQLKISANSIKKWQLYELQEYYDTLKTLTSKEKE